jgi:hypothetical protein
MPTFSKFGTNVAGITNSRGQELTKEYVSKYIQCWCRLPWGFAQANRKEIIASYLTPEYLIAAANRGLTGSQIGKEASLDLRWEKNAALRKVAVVEPKVEEPVLTSEEFESRFTSGN